MTTRNGDGPYDLDYNLLVMKADDEYLDLRLLKDTIRNALNKAAGGKFFSDAQDSTSCLTALLHFKDTPNVEFSFDVSIIKKNPNGNYMRLVQNKPWNQYTWKGVPHSHQVKDRADELKKAGLGAFSCPIKTLSGKPVILPYLRVYLYQRFQGSANCR